MINKLKDFKKKIDVLIMIIVCVGGLVGLIAQSVQFYNGLWLLPFYQEVFMLVFWFILARYPHKIVYLFTAISDRLRNSNLNTNKMDDKEKEVSTDVNVGGDGQGSSDEEV